VKKFWASFIWSFALLIAFAGCRKNQPQHSNPAAREREAKALFEKATKKYHLPSADALGAEKQKLLTQAAAAYEEVLNNFTDQPGWAAQAMRSLGNVRVEQGRVDDAIRLFEQVAQKFPNQAWEILQAWKTAGDVLWESNRRDEAKLFYKKIIDRFDTVDAPSIYKTVVHGARSRLSKVN
jgi:tetratricopeptide (TPR) repeat protein